LLVCLLPLLHGLVVLSILKATGGLIL
jgi:hypothetical protein